MTTFKDSTLNNVLLTSSEINADYLIGEIIIWPSKKIIPSGFLECNGSSNSKSTYAKLYQVIGNKYGGDSNNFTLPNLNQGTNDNDRIYIKGFDDFNNYQNANSGNLYGGNNTIEEDNIPSHNHNVSSHPSLSFNTNNTFDANASGAGQDSINISTSGSIDGDTVRANRTGGFTSYTNNDANIDDYGSKEGSKNTRTTWHKGHYHILDYYDQNKLLQNMDDLNMQINYDIDDNGSNSPDHVKPRSGLIYYLIYAGV